MTMSFHGYSKHYTVLTTILCGSADIKQLGHANRQKLVEEVLTLMAREKQSQEV